MKPLVSAAVVLVALAVGAPVRAGRGRSARTRGTCSFFIKGAIIASH